MDATAVESQLICDGRTASGAGVSFEGKLAGVNRSSLSKEDKVYAHVDSVNVLRLHVCTNSRRRVETRTAHLILKPPTATAWPGTWSALLLLSVLPSEMKGLRHWGRAWFRLVGFSCPLRYIPVFRLGIPPNHGNCDFGGRPTYPKRPQAKRDSALHALAT